MTQLKPNKINHQTAIDQFSTNCKKKSVQLSWHKYFDDQLSTTQSIEAAVDTKSASWQATGALKASSLSQHIEIIRFTDHFNAFGVGIVDLFGTNFFTSDQ